MVFRHRRRSRDAKDADDADAPRRDTVGNLAIIIPALNEEHNIALAIKSALDEDDDDDDSGQKKERATTSKSTSTSTSKSTSTTVVVVDGGSSDGTVSAARRAGATLVLRCRTRGRGAQLAAGVAAVGLSGPRSPYDDCSPPSPLAFFLPPRRKGAKKPDTVLFLHADSRLPRRYRRSIEEALGRRRARSDGGGVRSEPSPSWGAFETVLPEGGEPPLPPIVSRFLSACVALRTRAFGLPYGDQGIFVRSRLLEDVGGVTPMPLMEDVDLVERLSRAGKRGPTSAALSTSPRSVNSRPAIARAAISTSGRRWAEKGIVRATALNLWTLARWRMGWASADDLAREYYGESSS